MPFHTEDETQNLDPLRTEQKHRRIGEKTNFDEIHNLLITRKIVDNFQIQNTKKLQISNSS